MAIKEVQMVTKEIRRSSRNRRPSKDTLCVKGLQKICYSQKSFRMPSNQRRITVADMIQKLFY